MKWKAELHIGRKRTCQTIPDAYVESENKLEACSMIMQYVLTMVNIDKDFQIEVRKLKEQQ